jgi:hypothetical protein
MDHVSRVARVDHPRASSSPRAKLGATTEREGMSVAAYARRRAIGWSLDLPP